MATVALNSENFNDTTNIELWKVRKLIKTLESYRG